MLHNPETLTSCFLQPEQDHEVHVGSPKSGREAAAAAAAIEQAAMQLVRSCGTTLLLARPLDSCLFPSAERHLWHSTPMLSRWGVRLPSTIGVKPLSPWCSTAANSCECGAVGLAHVRHMAAGSRGGSG